MHDWEFLAFFAVILVLFILVGLPVWILNLLYSIRREMDELRDEQSKELLTLRRRITELLHPSATAAPSAQPATAPSPAPAPPPAQPPLPAPAPAPAPAAAPVKAAPPSPQAMPPALPAFSVAPPARAQAAVPPSPPTPLPPRQAEPELESAAAILLRKAWNWIVVGEEFRRKDVPMEFAVASQWLLRIGILIFLFGGYFFIRYSIDRGYLGPAGRVALSTLAGALMIAGGLHLFGRKYQLLGQGLVGGGIALLYFSLYAAGSMFDPPLVSMPVAFAGMAFVTLVSATLSVRYRSILIAVLGLLGGYLTPVLLSTGTKNFPGLYSYLLLLGFGMLGVSWKRQWPILVWLAFACHTALVWTSLATFYKDPADFTLVMAFLAAFFLLFSTSIFIYNLATKTVASMLELIGLLLTATFFFGFGYWLILRTWPGQYEYAAWLALALCAYYVVHVTVLQQRGVHDRGLQTIFLGLGAIFLSITLPLLFSKGWLTVTWSVEALVLLWMSRKLNSPILRLLAGLLYVILIGRVIFHDIQNRFYQTPGPDDFAAYLRLLVPRLIQFLMPVLSLAGAWRMLKADAEAPGTPSGEPERKTTGAVSALALVLMYGLLFLYMNFEMVRFCTSLYNPLVHPGLTLVWVGLGAVILAYRRSLGPVASALLWSVLAVALLVKLVSYDLPAWELSLAPLRYGASYDLPSVLVRLLNFGLILGFATVTFRLLRPEADLRLVSLGAGWLALALLLAYLTLETGAALTRFLPAFQKAGISMLWSAYACALVIAGLRNRSRALRLCGLALFAVVVLKIHSDLAHAEALYRIVALVAVGVVLILASFFYLKYKERFESR